mgnify:CR=1 FL=1
MLVPLHWRTLVQAYPPFHFAKSFADIHSLTASNYTLDEKRGEYVEIHGPRAPAASFAGDLRSGRCGRFWRRI